MNMFFKQNRIESLEFFYFLQKLFLSLRGEDGKSTNPLILDFLLSENDLSFTEDSILEGVNLALEKINKYFTD